MNNSILPNFICIGAQKSGTTTLYDILRQHPEVFLPANKELHFFDDDFNYQKGMNYYKNFFADAIGYRAVGEITPAYLYFEKCPQRIYNTLGGDIKFIIILRNPVERAFSHYLMSYKRGYENKNFHKAVLEEKNRINSDYFAKSHFSYIDRGYYSKQIQNYFTFFSTENIKILIFEDFLQDKQNVVSSILEFLNVKSTRLKIEIKSNAAGNYPILLKKLLLSESKMKKRISSKMPANFKNNIKRILSTKAPFELTYEEKKFYYNKFFRKEIDELENLINKDLSKWKYD